MKLHFVLRFLFGPVPVYFSALAILILLTNAQYFGLVGVTVPRATKLASSAPVVSVMKYCDIFRGEWVPDLEAPYYNHKTCYMIQEHQNCLKYGRPDLGFLKWRWRPSGCELPRFDPVQFLQFARHKSLAFVGDSLARNHMQSLLCLLSQVSYPKDISANPSTQNKVYHYRAYNFTISMFWSPFLVRAREPDHDGPAHTGHWSLYLDEPDQSWVSEISRFDYVLVSAANWFSRPSLFYEKRRLVGCSFCSRQYGVPDLTLYYSQRRAWRVSLKAINDLENLRGRVIVRMLSPMSHFENGTWDQGGDCKRTQPLRSNETVMEGRDLHFYTAQMEEYRAAEKVAEAKGRRMMLMDATAAMLMRPDGHPSRYGHLPNQKVQLYNDCIHWCLPGPIDIWNDMLFQMLLA
ncbi:protein trichome birefringence-like 19 [Oryza brachyantha]|uniref:protein trichome birefringence-like 19 n=1 Tax=Oryza brachyantha TaxID=4533 RepID=UPI001ADA57C5|nr:protein trichome birefringence-like 19 [Oryza brachyantha]